MIGKTAKLCVAAALLVAVMTVDEQRAPARASKQCRTGDAVFAAAKMVWCPSSKRERKITEVVWSKRGDGLAFATRKPQGTTLFVILLGEGLDGHVMSWDVPNVSHHEKRRAEPTVTWLGRTRVGFGYSAVRPIVVASWSVKQW